MKVRKLQSRGLSIRAIAKKFGISRYAVRCYVNADTLPERRRPSMLDPFEPYLKKRREEGCCNGMQLWRELRKQGYPGSRKRVAQWVRQRREEPAPTTPNKYRSRSNASPGGSRAFRGSSPRQQVWLLLREPEDLSDDEQRALRQMRGLCEDVAAAHPLTQQFVRMIRAREAEAFDPWLEAPERGAV